LQQLAFFLPLHVHVVPDTFTPAAAAVAAPSAEVQGGGYSDDDEASAKPRCKPAKRGRKSAGSDDEGPPKRKPTGFCKPLQLSEEFAAACGKPEMTRGEVIKWIYSYVEQHDLKVGPWVGVEGWAAGWGSGQKTHCQEGSAGGGGRPR
jgi:hypothetical protein